MNYHDPRRPCQEELNEIKRKYIGGYTTSEHAFAAYKEEYKKFYGVELNV
jgi:hypothetical protein